MSSLLEEIRQQPEHIRHIFMWVCVVIVFSVVGFVWFKSTSKQFVALLHPEIAQERALAEKEKTLQQAQGEQLSPFATVFDSFNELRANISELFLGASNGLEVNNADTNKQEVPPHKLPLSN